MTQIDKLNLGCGEFHKQGYINLDYYAVTKPDVVHDLTEFPYPFADDRFSLIELDHVLEHLPDPFAVMRELHRIARHDGLIKIKVPHFSRGFTHPEHKRGFDISFPYYFRPDFKGGYQGVEFKLCRCRFRWFAQPELKKTVLSPFSFMTASIMGKIIDAFANSVPFFFARLACFWVGGFEEIEFNFKVVKCKKTL